MSTVFTNSYERSDIFNEMFKIATLQILFKDKLKHEFAYLANSLKFVFKFNKFALRLPLNKLQALSHKSWAEYLQLCQATEELQFH